MIATRHGQNRRYVAQVISYEIKFYHSSSWNVCNNVNTKDVLINTNICSEIRVLPEPHSMGLALNSNTDDENISDSKLLWPQVGPTWTLSATYWANVGPVSLAIWDDIPGKPRQPYGCSGPLASFTNMD